MSRVRSSFKLSSIASSQKKKKKKIGFICSVLFRGNHQVWIYYPFFCLSSRSFIFSLITLILFSSVAFWSSSYSFLSNICSFFQFILWLSFLYILKYLLHFLVWIPAAYYYYYFSISWNLCALDLCLQFLFSGNCVLFFYFFGCVN